MTEVQLAALTNQAAEIRKSILKMICRIQSGHLGGSFSIVEQLLVLYENTMRVDPSNPQWEERDRFILSKGHCAPALYAVLADKGYFPKEWLLTSFRRLHGNLQGHPDMKKTPGVDMTTGSLGIGLSAGCGMAYGLRQKGLSSRVYVLLGDGELNEGQVWEAAKTAAHLKLQNLTALVDLNGYQNDGNTQTEMSMAPLADKWRAFGWQVWELDGHDIRAIANALSHAAKTGPSVLLCRTQKGKGVSFMEADPVLYHSKCPDENLYLQAMEELSRKV